MNCSQSRGSPNAASASKGTKTTSRRKKLPEARSRPSAAAFRAAAKKLDHMNALMQQDRASTERKQSVEVVDLYSDSDNGGTDNGKRRVAREKSRSFNIAAASMSKKTVLESSRTELGIKPRPMNRNRKHGNTTGHTEHRHAQRPIILNSDDDRTPPNITGYNRNSQGFRGKGRSSLSTDIQLGSKEEAIITNRGNFSATLRHSASILQVSQSKDLAEQECSNVTDYMELVHDDEIQEAQKSDIVFHDDPSTNQSQFNFRQSADYSLIPDPSVSTCHSPYEWSRQSKGPVFTTTKQGYKKFKQKKLHYTNTDPTNDKYGKFDTTAQDHRLHEDSIVINLRSHSPRASTNPSLYNMSGALPAPSLSPLLGSSYNARPHDLNNCPIDWSVAAPGNQSYDPDDPALTYDPILDKDRDRPIPSVEAKYERQRRRQPRKKRGTV